MEWKAVIFGPDDTVWEGGTFSLTMLFDEDYPNKAPVVSLPYFLFFHSITIEIKGDVHSNIGKVCNKNVPSKHL